jgi:cysteine desulfurase family protein
MPPPRRYFDNAATSFPKPPAVAEAMLRFMTDCGAPGRGLYAEAREAGRIIRQCRQRIARLLAADPARPEQVIFTLNTTDALNLAIKGVLDHALAAATGPVHVVSTWMEHNSVLRPMHAMLERSSRIEWTRVPVDPATSLVDPADIGRAIRSDTVLVILNHASNVTGAIQPVADIARVIRAANPRTLFLLDAAQSLGHCPVDVRTMDLDLVAFPGHKGLLGPQGTGGLWIRPGVQDRLATIREGGTGNVSEEQTHPRMLPERFEAGSHNTVGIAGLSEGVAWLLERGIDAVRAHELQLMRPLLAAAAAGHFKGLHLLGAPPEHARVGVFSFVHDHLEPAEIATLLEVEFGILTRPGLHCAPLAHQTFHTAPPSGRGAVRLSLGPFLTPDDVTHAIDALAAITRAHAHAHPPAPPQASMPRASAPASALTPAVG